MRTIVFFIALGAALPSFAQSSTYADYDQGTRSDQIKAPTNVGHEVNSAINKARRTMNDKLDALGNSTLDSSQHTVMDGKDVFNVGGLVVNSQAPVQANNIIIVSRPGGAGGLEGPSQRPTPRRH
jgi:hypothetical protein